MPPGASLIHLSSMPPPRLFCLALLTCLIPACVLGSERTSGCRDDHPQDCGEGWVCRGGVCIRPTTPLSPALDAPDGSEGVTDGSIGGDGGDAAGDEVRDAGGQD